MTLKKVSPISRAIFSMRSCSRRSSAERVFVIDLPPASEEVLDRHHHGVAIGNAGEGDPLVAGEAGPQHVDEIAPRAERLDLAVAEEVERGKERLREEVRRPIGILAAVVLAVGEV